MTRPKQWDYESAKALYDKPFPTLVYEAHEILRNHFDPAKIQLTTILNVKTGGCPENCAYCPQSAHFDTGLKREKLWAIDEVKKQIKQAKENGATRFCIVSAWRSPPAKEFPDILDMVKAVKEEHMECCASLGMLTQQQAHELKEAGTDYYNHNLDTSREFYDKIITTRTYDERLETLDYAQKSGMNICCGGILGMGESIKDRIHLLIELTRLKMPPKSVTINLLMPVDGTPLEHQEPVDPIEHVKFIALARIMLPTSHVRLSAGRQTMSDIHQAMAFYAGANSVIAGDKYLTQSIHPISQDYELLRKLNMSAITLEEMTATCS